MMSRLPKPRNQSAKTTLPAAMARTSSPARAAMNNPFQVTPPPGRGLPKRLLRSPRTGSLSRPLSCSTRPLLEAASGTRSLLLRDLARDASKHFAASAFFVFEALSLRRRVLGERSKFGSLDFRFMCQRAQLLLAFTQLFDDVGARTCDIAQVLQCARDAVGI